MQINTAHNKSKQISEDMITKVNDYWLIIPKVMLMFNTKLKSFNLLMGVLCSVKNASFVNIPTNAHV